MENTEENHGKFRAQYFLQHVLKDPQGVKHILDAVYFGFSYLRDGSYLELTPLSMITTEHVHHVCEICSKTPEEILGWINGNMGLDVTAHHIIAICDYLRGKSYAIAYNNLPVEAQITRGWIKLKTN